jgi:CheY-like chemotaxis protein
LVIKEERAKVKTAAASEIRESKRELIRLINHELRSPLNVIVSGLALVDTYRETVCAPVLEVAEEMQSACTIACDLLDYFFLYDAIECGELALTRERCNADELLRGVMKACTTQARHSGVELRLVSSVLEPVEILVDDKRMVQAFRTLIFNAVSFSPPGSVVSVEMSVSHDQRMRVSVRDAGPGLSPEARRDLLCPTVGIESTSSELQYAQGKGLGMHVSRCVLELLGGTLAVDADWEGPGAVFYLELPLLPPEELSAMAVDAESVDIDVGPLTRKPRRAGSLRVLIVDDVALCRRVHRRMFASASHIVEAADGREAVEAMRVAIESGRPFDCCLMDSSMPQMNGTEATRLIREMGYSGRIFGITGNGHSTDVDFFLAQGADAVFIKPLLAAQTNAIIQELTPAE